MADDLRSRIAWLEHALQQEEREEAEPEEDWYDEELPDDFDDELEDIKELLNPGYNYAADSSRTVYADETPVPEEKPTRAAKKTRQAAPVKKKGIKGLVFLAVLETMGILAIIGWWLRWLI